jgi:hypothetical protein
VILTRINASTGNPLNVVGSGTSSSTNAPGSPTPAPGLNVSGRGRPIRGILVVLVPDRNRDHAELFKSATTDQTGHYSIRGIPPGDYKLFAWETLESFGYFDPELLKQSESQGKIIHINESSKLNQDIRSILPAP